MKNSSDSENLKEKKKTKWVMSLSIKVVISILVFIIIFLSAMLVITSSLISPVKIDLGDLMEKAAITEDQKNEILAAVSESNEELLIAFDEKITSYAETILSLQDKIDYYTSSLIALNRAFMEWGIREGIIQKVE